jgi:hypothetical protein
MKRFSRREALGVAVGLAGGVGLASCVHHNQRYLASSARVSLRAAPSLRDA